MSSQREEIEKERKLLIKRKPGAAGGKSNRHVATHDSDGTKSPLPPLTIEEYLEREEVLKLRVVSLKKVRMQEFKVWLNINGAGVLFYTERRRDGIRNGEVGTGT